jgi:outer membrane protein assembly factor BamB
VGAHGALAPITVAKDAYVGGRDGAVARIGDDGEVKWRRLVGAPVAVAPMVGADGDVYFAAHDCVVAIAASGRMLWRLPLHQRVLGTPALADDGRLVVATVRERTGGGRGELLAISPRGSVLARLVLSGTPVAGLTLARDLAWVALTDSTLHWVAVPSGAETRGRGARVARGEPRRRTRKR